MYGVNTIEEKRDYILKRAHILRDAAGSVNRVKEVIRDFDGKIYNCRFDEAIANLTDEDHRFYVSNHYGWFYIQFSPRKGNYNNTQSILSGYSCKASDQVREQTRQECILFDGKRINAAAMINGLNNKREELLREAYTLESAADNLEKTLQQITDTKALLNNLVQGLPSIVRDACGLKYCY